MKNKSFTLIELLVVIVIIGILSSVIIISVSDAIDKANFAKAQAFSSTVKNELFSDLISEWTFDEDSGTTAKDTAGNNDGTVVGATYVPKSDNECVYGSCYSFDGNDYITINGSDTLTSSLAIKEEITLSVWIKLDTLPTGAYGIIGKGNSIWSNYAYGLRVTSSKKVGFLLSSSGEISTITEILSNNALKTNEWYYVVATFNKPYRRIYMDGVLQNIPTDWNGDVYKSTASVGIGLYAFGNGLSYMMDGLIDDVRIYDKALSSAQIKREYIAGINSLYSKGLISREEYDQRIGELANK